MSLKTADDVQVGDVVEQEAFGGIRRIVTVTEVSNDIKNGRKGFSGTTEEGLPVWGYCSQIRQYITHA